MALAATAAAAAKVEGPFLFFLVEQNESSSPEPAGNIQARNIHMDVAPSSSGDSPVCR